MNLVCMHRDEMQHIWKRPVVISFIKMAASMSGVVGENEIRVSIRPVSVPGIQSELLPALLFKKIFDGFLVCLVAADSEIHPRQASSEFLLSDLALDSYEFGFLEKQRAFRTGRLSAIEFFRRCSIRVYRSDYQILLRYQRLLRAFHRLVKALDPRYLVLVQYRGMELPMDEFFCSQLGRVGETEFTTPTPSAWFNGSVITSFQGQLEAIDYHGLVWKGRLRLSGSDLQIECVFEKSGGEDTLNQFGNKFVNISGRAIFTGDSQLPERIEVLNIERTPRTSGKSGFGSSLMGSCVMDWGDPLDQVS